MEKIEEQPKNDEVERPSVAQAEQPAVGANTPPLVPVTGRSG